MKSRVIEEIKTKYIYVIFLVIYICILLGMATYEFTHVNSSNMGMILNGNTLKLENNLLEISNQKYITKDDLILNFKNNVFYDKISRKLVITTWDNILKIKTGEEITSTSGYTIWYNITKLSEYFGYTNFKDIKKNSIYIHNYDEIEASIVKCRTEVYNENNLDVIGIVDNKSDITVLLDKNIYNENIKYATVKVVDDKTTYVGRIEKCDLKYELQSKANDIKDTSKVIMTSISKKISANTDLTKINTLAVDMLRIGSEKNIIEETYTLDTNLKQDVYAVLTNGYKVPGFDTSVLSSIVASDINKEDISDQILDYLVKHNLKGIVIDFKNFKVTDKELISQYIKELAAQLHKNNKYIMIKMNDISNYDIDSINGFVDYIVVQAYGLRTVASKISGSHSSVPYVKTTLTKFAEKVDSDKIILEIMPYSILWTERAGTVINAQEYSMDACTQYIKANDINIVFDEVSGQNIINYTKGIITYKMWLEDKSSITSKVKLANEMNIAGFAIYKSGYENKDIYSVLKFEEE